MSPALAIIVLNHKRPQNIGRVTRAAREGLPHAPIFLIDQAEHEDLRWRGDDGPGDVWIQRASVNRGAGVRVPLAAALPFDLYLAIDDDTFLSPAQIVSLAEKLAAEPDRAHGIWGQRLEAVGQELQMRNGIGRVDAQLSILNQVYAFSRRQAQAAIALSARLGFGSWDEIGPIDDMLLSCASAKPPLCHDLGPFDECPTHDQPGVAVWMSEGFNQARGEGSLKLFAAGAIAVFTPMTYRADP